MFVTTYKDQDKMKHNSKPTTILHSTELNEKYLLQQTKTQIQQSIVANRLSYHVRPNLIKCACHSRQKRKHNGAEQQTDNHTKSGKIQ